MQKEEVGIQKLNHRETLRVFKRRGADLNGRGQNAGLYDAIPFVVQIDATKMEVSSRASWTSGPSFRALTISDSCNSSSQYTVSSASSRTIPSFAKNSALDRARQAAR